MDLLVSALLRGGWVVAWFLSTGKGAVVFSVTMGSKGVIVMLSGIAGFGSILGSLTDWLSVSSWTVMGRIPVRP